MGRKPIKHTCGLAIVVGEVTSVTVQAPAVNEKKKFQWEDKATGDYFRESSGVRADGNQYYRYHNVTVGNKSGYSKRYFVEEKFQQPTQSSYKGGKKYYKALKYYD